MVGGVLAVTLTATAVVAVQSGSTTDIAVEASEAVLHPAPPESSVAPSETTTTTTTAAATTTNALAPDPRPRAATTPATEAPTTTVAPTPPEVDADDPAVVARPLPTDDADTPPPPPTLVPPPWAASTRQMLSGHVGVDVGCVPDLSARSLDLFLADRIGPVLGWDYQHVYPLGGDRYLWLFQDTFVDHGGMAAGLGQARFVHNAALLQQGRCFTLLHRGTPEDPKPFEEGHGRVDVLTRWFWPRGGELVNGQLWVFWVEMVKDGYDPRPPDGLGWHPERLYLASYDAMTLQRTSFRLATDSGVSPIYGYAVASDATHTYLFGNTFEQNLVREGGFHNGPHSATRMWLARVPRGHLLDALEYRTADGWSPHRHEAVPIVSRYYVENPMQPRFLDGQWVAATAVDGYWGEALAIDVAPEPWGPWTTVTYQRLLPRGFDPLKNTYHAHLMPWRGPDWSLVVTVSNNARDMGRDAWPHPHRYRPMAFPSAYHPTPPPPPAPPPPPTPDTTTTSVPTTVPPTTTTSTTSTTTTTVPPATTTTTTTSTTTTTTTTTTTLPPTTTTTSAPESTTTTAPEVSSTAP